jgi:hypothetical protein
MVSIRCCFGLFNCSSPRSICNISFCSRPPFKINALVIINDHRGNFYGALRNDSIYSIRKYRRN